MTLTLDGKRKVFVARSAKMQARRLRSRWRLEAAEDAGG